jgi:PPM family protein phosphatase
LARQLGCRLYYPLMIISAAAATDIGRVRGRNEDSFLLDADAGLFAVADGMGGHAAGDVASQTAMAAFHATFRDTRSMLASAKSANRAVFERAAADPRLRGMGTTLTALHVFGNAMFVGHVGDSRLYLLRAGELTQLTRDHTAAQERIEQGVLTKLDAMRHPLSSMLTRALGLQPDVEVDVCEHDLVAGDVLLLCSDGLTGMITEEDLQAILMQSSALEEISSELIDAANLRGGVDNITALVVGAR